jgi:hypothetical protein
MTIATKTFNVDREAEAGYLPTVTLSIPDTDLKYMWKNGRWYQWSTEDDTYYSTSYVCDFSRSLTDTFSESNAHGILNPTDGKVTFWRGQAFVEIDIHGLDFEKTANVHYLGEIIAHNALRVHEAFKAKYPATKSSHTTTFSV